MIFTIHSSPISPRYRELIVTDFEDPELTLRSGLLTEAEAKDLATRLREVAAQLEKDGPPANITVFSPRDEDHRHVDYRDVFAVDIEQRQAS